MKDQLVFKLLIKEARSSAFPKVNGAAVFANLSLDSSFHDFLFTNDLLPIILEYMQDPDKEIKRHALRAVAALTTTEKLQVRLVREGVMNILYDIVSEETSDNVLRGSIKSLFNLSFHAENYKLIFSKQGLNPLLALMNKKLFQEDVAYIAKNLAHCHPPVQELIDKNGELKELVNNVEPLEENEEDDVINVPNPFNPYFDKKYDRTVELVVRRKRWFFTIYSGCKVCKPVIYLYPPTEIEINVQINSKYAIAIAYPPLSLS